MECCFCGFVCGKCQVCCRSLRRTRSFARVGDVFDARMDERDKGGEESYAGICRCPRSVYESEKIKGLEDIHPGGGAFLRSIYP